MTSQANRSPGASRVSPGTEPGQPQCTACGSSQSSFLYRWNRGLQVWRCRSCGLLYTHPLPTPSELADYYRNLSRTETQHGHMRPWRDLDGALPAIRQCFSHYLEIATRILGAEGVRTVLDVGGGVGLYSKAAESLGCEPHYVEIDEQAVEFARERLQLEHVTQADVQTVADAVQGRFDFVLCRHVIEHVRDPALLVEHLARLAKPGAIVVVETPNAANWEQWAHPRILGFYWATLRRENPDLPGTRRLVKTVTKPLSAATPPKHLYGFDRHSLSLLLRRHGLRTREAVVTVCGDRVFDPLYYGPPAARRNDLVGRAYRSYERVSSTGLRRLGKGSRLVVFAQKERG